MKIAYVVNNYGEISETFTRDLVNGFATEGNSVTIFCNRYKNQDLFKNSKQFADVKEVKFSELSFEMKLLDRFYNLIQKKALREEKLLKYQQKRAFNKLINYFQTIKPDVVFIDFGTVAVQVQKVLEKLKIPFFVHFHAMDITKALNNSAYRKALPSLFDSCSQLIVPSAHVKRLLILEGAKPEKVNLVRLGVNLEGLTPLSWNERVKLDPCIVFLGRFTPKKHPVALVEAFNIVKKKISNAKLTMIGDGEEMSRVKSRIDQLQLNDSVHLCGALPHKEALSLINRHWLLAQHSVVAFNGDQEGFPVALVEGATLELPIVSTYHSGIPEQVIDGKTGFLVREFDYPTMAEKMIELLENPDLAEKMGKAGRENITQMCNTQRRIAEILSILSQRIKPQITP